MEYSYLHIYGKNTKNYLKTNYYIRNRQKFTAYMNKIVIAIDSFKGSLTSEQAAKAAEKAVKDIFPECDVHRISVADGGEGTVEAIKRITETKSVKVKTVDPLFREIYAEYIICKNGKAIIELAAASGITLLDEKELNPLKTSTYGTGLLIADALDKGCRDITLTLGGSATNDAGIGILKALGIKFTDCEGNETDCNGNGTGQVCHIDVSGLKPEAKDSVFTLACDVTNPLYGPNGAAFVFARQKGADNKMIESLDKGLHNIGSLYSLYSGKDIPGIPGAGAAGGTAAGLISILDAQTVSGAEFLLNIADFDKLAEGADLIITGEGKIDNQTLDGKLPAIVASHACASRIPVIAVCGRCTASNEEKGKMPFEIIEATPKDIGLHEAMKPQNASRLVYESLARYLKAFNVTDISNCL